MSTTIDQKAYLQKYLSGSVKDKKKKKKKVVKGKGIKIIDDDLDLTKLRPLDGDELDILDEGEDAPQIAGIIDERPEELKKIEQFQSSSKWRVINQDDGFNNKLQVQEIKRDIKEVAKENEIIFGKMYSDSEDEAQKDSDLSPPRHKDSKSKGKDSDSSPPRKRNASPKTSKKELPHTNKKDKYNTEKDKHNSVKDKYDSDPSPPRQRESRDKKRRKPSRWGQEEKESRKSTDSDISPPRRSKNSQKTNNKSSKHDRLSPDQSPPRKSTKKSPERSKKQYDQDISPQRKRSTDKSILEKDRRKRSPFRTNDKRRIDNRTKDTYKRYSDTDKRKRNESDSDLSPPRNKNKRSNDSDLSPPRKERDRRSDKKRNSDSDLSPPRRKEKNRSIDNASERDRYRRNSDSPPPTNKKMAKTLEGKKAGLQDARQLREENDQFRKKEDEVFKRMADDVSGRNAQVVSRRSKRETSEDRQKQKEKAERQKQIDEKYKKWSKGLKQLEAQEERMQEYLHESNKPLARHRDDRDLEDRLKEVERDGDPMLQFIRERKRERGELPPEKPMYKGNFPPNRFNIRPGYRWDGVDRSNGYEKKYFDQQSKRKAQAEEAYKWSTEDL